jgi:hypothetical protein
MEKSITKDRIKKISAKEVKNMIDILSDVRTKNQNKPPKEKKNRKNKGQSMSSTSSEEIPSESNFSDTSF